MTVKPSNEILPFPLHGGNRLQAAELAGLLPEEILDFSVSVNPLGPSADLEDAWRNMLGSLKSYPDPESRELKIALAEKLNVGPKYIAVGNGSTELIHVLPCLFSNNCSVLIVEPCFSEYEAAFARAGVSTRRYFLKPENGFAPHADSLVSEADGLHDLKAIVIGSPNNPTGTLWDEESLGKILDYCERKAIYLIIDETFIEFTGRKGIFLQTFPEHRNLILIRSLTKFYGVPGLRFGYAILRPELRLALESRLPPWSVGSLTQAACPVLLNDVLWKQKTLQWLEEEYEFLFRKLRALAALETYPSRANFILFRLANEFDPDDFYESLLERGILLRNCGNFHGLGMEWFRVAIKTRNENEKLIRYLNDIL